MPELSSEVVVVGAGAAGLAAGAALRRSGIDPLIVERSSSVGGLWDPSVPGAAGRPDVRLVSSAARLGFNGAPVDSSHPYPLQGEVLAYLRGFAEDHLDPRSIRFGTEVVDFTQTCDGDWCIRLRSGGSLRTEALVICTGLYGIPYLPVDEAEAPEPCVHSRDFDPLLLRPGDRVRVVGAGNSSADVALSAHRAGAEVWLQWRSVPWLLPSFVGGRPADTVAFALDYVPESTRGLETQRQLVGRAAGIRGRVAAALGGAAPTGLPYETATIASDRLADLLLSGADGIKVAPHQGHVPRYDLTVYCTGYRRPIGSTGLSRIGVRRDPLGIAAISMPGLYFVGNVNTEGGGFGVFSQAAEVVASLISHRRDRRSHERLLAELDAWSPDLLRGLRRDPDSDLVYSEALFDAMTHMLEMVARTT